MVSLKRENDVNNNNNIRSWIGKMFYDPGRYLDRSSTNNDDPTTSGSPWDTKLQEIENYFQQLLILNLEDEDNGVQEEEAEDNGVQEEEDDDHVALDVLQHMNVAEKLDYVRRKVNEAKLIIEEKMREVKVNAERSDKAEWAISLCNCRIQELEAGIKEESESREKLQRTLDSDKECIEEAKNDIEKGKTKLNSLGELREELSSKVKTMMEAKSQTEAELERVVLQRGEIVMEIEKLRNQRDVFNRRINFCKENEAIGLVSKEELTCGYREYVAEDIRVATESYSNRLRLKSGGNYTNVYRGRIKHTTVALKVIGDRLSKVQLLNEIRHPNLVAIAGFCSQKPKCILFEYMHNGNLRDNLFTSQRKSRRSKILKWHDRIRIAHQVCSGLGFLHSVKPKPIVHGRLTRLRSSWTVTLYRK